MSIFDVTLESLIDMNHKPVLLSRQIDWEAVESESAEYYCADNEGHWMNKNAFSSFVSWLKTLVGCLKNVIFGNENKSARLCPTLEAVE